MRLGVGTPRVVPIGEISVGKRLRALDKEKVRELSGSIKQIGLMQALIVTPREGGEGYKLVAGRHRLAASKELGWETIPVIVVDADNARLRLMEIDENLVRADLSKLERGQHFKERKVVWEILYPETKRGTAGGTGKGRSYKKRAGAGGTKPAKKRGAKDTTANLAVVNDADGSADGDAPRSFVTDTAAKTGASTRAIHLDLHRAEKIAEDVQQALLEKAPRIADSGKDLDALAKMDHGTQRAVVQLIIAGAKSVSAAKKKIDQQAREAAKSAQVAVSPDRPVVYLCDCLEHMATMEACSVDLLLTDPLYSTDVEDIASFAALWAPLACQLVKATGRAYVCTGAYPHELAAYLDVFRTADLGDLHLEQVLVWTYRNTMGPAPKNAYKANWQAVFYLVGTEAPPLDCPDLNELFSVQDISAPDGRQGGRYHAWQKPDALGERFIRHATAKGDTVFDPFACTGTFVLAAARLGRVGIGCEIDPDAAKLSEGRGCQVVVA